MSIPYPGARWPAATSTTLVWGLAAASVVFWGLRLIAPSGAVAPPVVARAPAAVEPSAVAQALGAVSGPAVAAPAPEAASRFALLGVVADAGQHGVALIAVDGKPPRPFRVGTKVADGYVLHSVQARAAALGASPEADPAFTLQLPVPPFAPNPPRRADGGVDSAPAPVSAAPPPAPVAPQGAPRSPAPIR